MNKKKIFIIFAIVFCIASAVFTLKTFVFVSEDTEFIEKVRTQAVTANILIMTETTVIDGNSKSVSYSSTLSGVIFKKEGDRYYALTAAHGIHPAQTNSEIIVLGHDEYAWNDYSTDSNMERHYSWFPRAVIEKHNPDYDLAVISFVPKSNSEQEFAVLPIAETPPEYKEAVAALGNPFGYDRNLISTGFIKTKEPVEFRDESIDIKHNVFEHSAKTYSGSSGGAILNKDMEIVGIHMGVGENIFGNFVRGMAVPSDKVLEFLANP